MHEMTAFTELGLGSAVIHRLGHVSRWFISVSNDRIAKDEFRGSTELRPAASSR